MHTVQLPRNLVAPPTTIERSEPSVIMGEIAERLLELCEVQGERRTLLWLLKLGAMGGSECPRAVWHYLRFATGDLSALTDSHALLGSRLARSKQAEHKEHHLALAVIKRHHPELAQALAELKAT